ncbi:hypothetical protein ACFPRL_10445 [Pseudoclavibacter helvolus]
MLMPCWTRMNVRVARTPLSPSVALACRMASRDTSSVSTDRLARSLRKSTSIRRSWNASSCADASCPSFVSASSSTICFCCWNSE